MKKILYKLFVPWRCEVYFDDLNTFYGFLVRRNKTCNTVRVILFAVAAVLIFIGYNADDGGGWSLAAVASHPYYLIAVGVLVLALLVSLVIIQNEKQLPEELRMK